MFGRDSIFRDVNIPAGLDFKTILEREVAACDVMLAIMGRDWLNDEHHARLHQEDDFVRIEIETALRRDIPVIPLLVARRTTMPGIDDLPTSLQPLVYRQAMLVRADPDFHADVDRLIARITEILELMSDI